MQPTTAEEKILYVLEKIKDQYDLGPKTPTANVPLGRNNVRRAIEVRFTTGTLVVESGIPYQELKRILGRMKEDGVILERNGNDVPTLIVWLNTDFEEQYKRYRAELGQVDTAPKQEREIPSRAEVTTQASKIHLSEHIVQFDDTRSAILVGTRVCALPIAKNEEYLARAMFSRLVGEFVDWSLIYSEITGTDPQVVDIESLKNLKMVRDTMDRMNKRVQEVIGTDDHLFSWENKSLCRNY